MQARQVLLERVDVLPDGTLQPNDGFERRIYGATDGEIKLRTLGVTARERWYNSDKDHRQAVYQAGKAMKNIGRGVHFTGRENIYGCLIRTYILYPVVLAFYMDEDGELVLAGFTPRCLTARLAVYLAMKKFEQETGNIVERYDEKPMKAPKHTLTREQKKRIRNSKWPVSKKDPNKVWYNQEWITWEEAEAREAAKNAASGEDGASATEEEAIDAEAAAAAAAAEAAAAEAAAAEAAAEAKKAAREAAEKEAKAKKAAREAAAEARKIAEKAKAAKKAAKKTQG